MIVPRDRFLHVLLTIGMSSTLLLRSQAPEALEAWEEIQTAPQAELMEITHDPRTELLEISDERITQAKNDYSTELYWNAAQDYGLKVATVGVLLGALYYYKYGVPQWLSKSLPTGPQLSIQERIATLERSVADLSPAVIKLSSTQANPAEPGSAIAKPHVLWRAGKAMINVPVVVGKQVLLSMGCLAGSFVGADIVSKIYPRTQTKNPFIQFMTTHTFFLQTIEQLQHYAKAYEHYHTNPKLGPLSKNNLITVYNMLIQDIEKALGYMAHKHDTTSIQADLERQRIEMSSITIREITSYFHDTLIKALESHESKDASSVTTISFVAAGFVSQLQKEIIHMAQLEAHSGLILGDVNEQQGV